MDNNRNLILAMVLSVGVLFIWQALVIAPREEARREAAERIAAEQQVEAPAQTPAGTPGVTPGTTPTTAEGVPRTAAPAAAEPTEAEREARRVPLSSGSLAGSINLRGARIDDLKLLDYRETVDPTSPNITLLRPDGTGFEAPYFAEFGFFGADAGALPGPDTVWTAPEDAQLSPATPLRLTFRNERGLVFERTITLDDAYMFTVRDRVSNEGDAGATIQSYGRVARFGTPATQGIYVLHEGLVGFIGEQGLDEIDYDDIREDGQVVREPASTGWLGITDKYWATALVPSAETGPFTAAYKYVPSANPFYQTDFASAPLAVAPGATVEVSSRLFAGAKKAAILDAYEEGEAGAAVPRLSNLIDWGWFYFITYPLFTYVMFPLYQWLGNVGLAILGTTVVVKAFFFYFANLSYKSMAKMKVVQPEMQALREKHGDDRAALQKEMMEIYKREKINPAAGCLPILIQIPVFFALYKIIYVTIEVRHAPFFGWIQDLSAPDPTSIFNLFGLLPYDVPVFLLIGVWPLLMGITMFVQMQMNPAPPDPTQAMIFKWMPVVFTLMLATFPAGLVIYWAWNNFLSIIQQGVIMKRQGAKIELWDNLKGMFGRKAPDPAE